ncbi:OmpA family protein [Motilimonas eburnea]|uniref:OmpA family protein n=1 Tax=Motilimonas eburnea TaxID=1737488 RepID=UPI001E40E843|nr:OmpA family protein [Motilimonas eburnea]MCE2570731.1 OmpA family protein [Motilimonas eburnea]
MNNKWLVGLMLLPLVGCVQMADLQVQRYQIDDLRDQDKDGVINQRDLCRDTPTQAKVDDQGCAIWHQHREVNRLVFHFDYDKAQLKSEDLAKVAQLADWLREDSKASLTLIGDTSAEGSLEYNTALAQRRNQAIANALVATGISRERIASQVFSEQTKLTQYLKQRQRRTIAVISHGEFQAEQAWDVFANSQIKEQ